MSGFGGRKKSKKGAGRNRAKNGPGEIDSKDNIAESPQIKKVDIPKVSAVTPGGETDHFESLPTTPHRAFRGFNDSVDNINLEDLRDMLPEDVWRDVQPEGHGAGGKCSGDFDTPVVDESRKHDMLNVIAEEESESQSSPYPSPNRSSIDTVRQCIPATPVADTEQSTRAASSAESSEEAEVELELLSTEDCSSDIESFLGHGKEDRMKDSTASQDSSKRMASDIYDPKYRYGPAVTKKRRGVRSVFSGKASPGGRSYVEVAEAVVLTVLDAVRSTPGTPAFRSDTSTKPAVLANATEERAAGVGRRVRGALGYVLHTVLSLVYTVFVQYPLNLLLAVFSLWYSATSVVVTAVVQGATWLFSVYVWLLFLPVRLIERGAVLLWQKALLLAVQFLNSHTATGANNEERNAADSSSSSSKHTIPTALNGHAHKH